MDLTDEELLDVFEQLDADDDGYVSMESLLSFAQSGGHSVRHVSRWQAALFRYLHVEGAWYLGFGLATIARYQRRRVAGLSHVCQGRQAHDWQGQAATMVVYL